MDQIVQNIVHLFSTSSSKELIIFIVSMLPILELRGGILAAGMLNVDMVRAFFICLVGTLFPIPFILLFIRQILDWMRNTRFVKLVKRIEAKAEEKSKSIEKYKTFGLFVFVAIQPPLDLLLLINKFHRQLKPTLQQKPAHLHLQPLKQN